MMTYFFWMVTLVLLLVPLVFPLSEKFKYVIVVYLCIIIGYSLERELELYTKPIESMPVVSVDFTYNHHKMLLRGKDVYLMVWLTKDEIREYLYVFKYDEKSKELKKQFDELKKKAEAGEPTTHRYKTNKQGNYTLEKSPVLVQGQPKNY